MARCTLCDKVCQWLVAGRWFSPSTSAPKKTDCYDITEILLKMALSTITQKFHFLSFFCWPVLGITASGNSFGIFKRLTIALSVLRIMASDYLFGIFKRLTIVLSVLWITASDYSFGIFKRFFYRHYAYTWRHPLALLHLSTGINTLNASGNKRPFLYQYLQIKTYGVNHWYLWIGYGLPSWCPYGGVTYRIKYIFFSYLSYL